MVESENLRRSQQQLVANSDTSFLSTLPNLTTVASAPVISSASTNSLNITLSSNTKGKRKKAAAQNSNANKTVVKDPKSKLKKSKSKSTTLPTTVTNSQNSGQSTANHHHHHHQQSYTNNHNHNNYINDAYKARLLNDPQTFSVNSLFHSPTSLLTKLDLKALFQPAIFESLPRQSQLKLIKLLPECDRQLDSHGSFK